jgi:hypothetical protein
VTRLNGYYGHALHVGACLHPADSACASNPRSAPRHHQIHFEGYLAASRSFRAASHADSIQTQL